MLADKDKWIEEVMQSLDGAQRAEPGPFLYHGIRRRIQAPGTEEAPGKLVWLAAAFFALLLLLNVGLLRKNSDTGRQESQALASGYHLLNNNMVTY